MGRKIGDPLRPALVPNLAPDDDPPPEPPTRPSQDDCCRGGCDPCVFDLYDEAVERYRAELKAWEARRARREQPG